MFLSLQCRDTMYTVIFEIYACFVERKNKRGGMAIKSQRLFNEVSHVINCLVPKKCIQEDKFNQYYHPIGMYHDLQ